VAAATVETATAMETSGMKASDMEASAEGWSLVEGEGPSDTAPVEGVVGPIAQANRAVPASQQARGTLMAHIASEDDNGIVVRGARLLATIGPFADELLVFPSTLLRNTPEDKQYSFACAIPNDAPGLRYLAREPLDYGRSRHDHPLGSRFEESDAVVVFDDVHVPYERCFVLGDPELCNGFYTRTSAAVHMTHQVIARTTAKTEYILGLVSLLTEAIGIGQFQHVQADVAEVITTLETLRAFGRAALADAEPNEFGVLTPAWAPLNAARNLYPRLYQRFPEILRKLGASGLMATPTQADVVGPAAADIETYLQSATLGGAERVIWPPGHQAAREQRAPRTAGGAGSRAAHGPKHRSCRVAFPRGHRQGQHWVSQSSSRGHQKSSRHYGSAGDFRTTDRS